MKYTTYREFYKKGDIKLYITRKEWENLDKAISYAKRYSKADNVNSIAIFDKKSNVVYLVTKNRIYDNREKYHC